MKRKSQVSIEFMIFVGLAVIVLGVFTVSIVMQINSIYMEREKIVAERLADTMRYEVDIAAKVSNGYIRKTTLPQSIGGWNYDLVFDKRYVFVSLDEEAEQGDFISGLSAEIENSNPPDELIVFEVEFDKQENREVVIQKKNDKVYVCSLKEFVEHNDQCGD